MGLFRPQASQTPTALGTMLQSAVYGSVLYHVYGCMKAPPLPIWAAHLRQGSSSKKGKKKGMKTYVENIDMFVGVNPIQGILDIWANSSDVYPLNFVKVSTGSVPGNPGGLFPFWPGVDLSADPYFYELVAVTADVFLSGTFADYGSATPSSAIANALPSLFPGTGYAVNDTFTINGGSILAQCTVTAIGAGGAVTAFSVDSPGAGYSVGAFNVPTTNLTGSGSGLLVSIFAVGVAYSGTYEYPLWNAAQHGPDLINAAGARWYPYTYFWTPACGPIVYIPSYGSGVGIGATGYNFYYAQRSSVLKHKSPLDYNRFAFETQLANGDEYSDAGLSGQQNIMPSFAGVESSETDLGSSGTIQAWRFEVHGSYTFLPPRDVEFADVIEDLIKAGQVQVGEALGIIPRGVNCNDLPGIVQKAHYAVLEPTPTSNLVYAQANAAGSILLAFFRWRPSGGTNPTISDAPVADSWTNIFASPNSLFAYATSLGAPSGNVVTGVFNGLSFAFDNRGYIFEMDPGSNQVLKTAVSQGTSASNPQTVSCSIYVSKPCYILMASEVENLDVSSIPPHWDVLNVLASDAIGSTVLLMKRYVTAPGVYTFSLELHGGYWNIGMIALAGQPSPLPKTLGNIIDEDSLFQTRLQCRAGGLQGSLLMDSQRQAGDSVGDLVIASNTAPVWDGFKLYFIPRSEVSAVGQGAVYHAPTAGGPVADLKTSDFVGDPSTPMITIERTAQVDADNIDQIQCFNRNDKYNQAMIAEPQTGAIALYGERPANPVLLPMIVDPAVARKIAAINGRRRTTLRNIYKFILQPRFFFLRAMAMVTITDELINLFKQPVRLTSISENDKHELVCQAEPFVYGVHAPDVDFTAPVTTPYAPDLNSPPGPVNPPIFVEVPLRMSASGSPELWAVVSDSDPQYGGSVVFVSVDGGASYAMIGTVQGNATTGYLTADWPAAADPDATNDLSVDLTESLGSLASYTANEENSFLFPNFVAASPGPTPSFFGGGGSYGGLEPSQGLSYVLTAASLNILVCATRGGGVAVWFNPKIASGFTRFITDITSHCGPNLGGFVIDTPSHTCETVAYPCGLGCSGLGQCPPAINDGQCANANPDSRPGDIPAGPTTFSYDFENMVVGIADGGKIVGISNSNALNEVTFSLSGWGTGPIMYILEVAPVTPGNPHLYVAITFGAPGPTPAGWTKVVTGANVFSAFTQVGTEVDPPGSNYELMTYQTATLTAPHKYTMPATAPAPLRRAVFGLPFVGEGEDHATSSRFAWLNIWQSNPTPPGILKLKLDPTWINRDLFFKFVQFSALGGAISELADAVPYQYTPVGLQAGGGTSGGGTGSPGQPGQTTYQVTGGALTNPTATTIHMDKAFVTFSNGNAVYYNARTLTITDPVVPTTYFVTIFDPNLLGDTGTSTALVAQANLTQQFVGLPGYIYIGSILVLPGGGGIVTTPGGYPPAEQITVNGV